jgi:hypothetical protein
VGSRFGCDEKGFGSQRMMFAKIGVPSTLVGMVLLLACPKSGEESQNVGAGGTQGNGVAGSSPGGTAGTAAGGAAANAGAGGTGAAIAGFGGDQDLIGTWDVTLEYGSDTHACSAEIADNLDFVIECTEVGSTGEFEEGCDDNRFQRFTGSINGLTGTVELHSVDLYSGSACPSFGFEPEREYPDQTEIGWELTRTEAGVGTLGGTWTAQLFEWDCGECLTADAPTSRDDFPYDCDFELNANGSISLSCVETSGDCNDQYTALGSIANGTVDVDGTDGRVGSGCDAEDLDSGDAFSLHAVRR